MEDMPHACMKGRSDMGLSIGRTPSIEMKRSGIETALRINWITETFRVAMRPGDTPVPIPNTMVKTWTADGTMLETAWESRWLPGSLSKEEEPQV